MDIRTKAKTFFSNWLGVILAAVIVALAATFGGMYLYARSRLDNTLAWVTQDINLVVPGGFTASGTTENPLTYIYHVTLRVDNPSGDTASVTISDVNILLDTYTIPLVADGEWTKSVPTGEVLFEGDISINGDTFTALAARGTVRLEIKGNITATAQYNWVKRTSARTFDRITSAEFAAPTS